MLEIEGVVGAGGFVTMSDHSTVEADIRLGRTGNKPLERTLIGDVALEHQSGVNIEDDMKISSIKVGKYLRNFRKICNLNEEFSFNLVEISSV